MAPPEIQLRRKRLPRRALLAFAVAGLTAPACLPSPPARKESPLRRTAEVRLWLADQNSVAKRAFDERVLPSFRARSPWLQLRVEWKQWDRILDEVALTAGGGTGPDLFQFGFADAIRIGTDGLAAGLNGLLPAWGAASDFYPACRDAPIWDSVVWGVPTVSAPMAMFWRADLLEELGVSAPPATWEDSIELCRKAATVRSGELVREGINPPSADEILMLFMAAGGGPPVGVGRTRLNAAAGREAMRYAVQRWRAGRPGASSPSLRPAPLPYLASGMRVGQYGNMQSTVLQLLTRSPEFLDRLVVGPPAVPGGADFKPVGPGGGVPIIQTFTDSIAISALSAAADAAWETVKLLASPEPLLIYNQSLFLTPPRRASSGKAYTLEFGHGRLIEYLDRWGAAAPSISLGKRYREAITAQLGPLFAQAVTVEGALAQIETEQNLLLDEAALTG